MAIDRFEAVRRLLKVATGDEYGDGEMVTDIVDGYADDPDTDIPIVVGNWNNKFRYLPGDTTDEERERAGADQFGRVLVDGTPERLEAALERIGVEVEWYDQVSTCSQCSRLIRTEPDSYGWTPAYLTTEYGDVCEHCFREDINGWLADAGYIDDSSKAVTMLSPKDFEANGWTRWKGTDASDNGAYANGWHPGQDDKPEDVDTAIREAHGDDVEVLFVIVGVGQFDTRFGAYYRLPDTDASDE